MQQMVSILFKLFSQAGFFMLMLLLASCKNETPVISTAARIAKTVPSTYINASDRGFTTRQDTLYYRGSFFTGYQYHLYETGDTEYVRSYFNGVEEGSQKKWYPAKQLAEERFYINGKKEGIQQSWWPDGKPRFAFRAVNDMYEGEFREWNMTGSLCKHFHYVNGQEEGSQRLWWDNGTVRANYVVRNGKKYGLIGLTLCSNPYDSVLKK